jgi:fatty-acyl-CoA synthase
MELIEKTFGQFLEQWATETPDKDFIVYPDRNLRFSYADFNIRVDNLAKALLHIGMRPDDKLGIFANNVPDWLTFMFASAKIGVVLVTINTNYKTHELEYLIKNSDLKTICLVNGWRDSDYVQMIYELVPELKDSQRGYLQCEKFPYLKNVIFIGQEKHRGMFNTAELILLGSQLDEQLFIDTKSTISCHDVVNMQYTSGTTGFPKGVMLTHYNILNNGFATGQCMNYTTDDRLCVWFHCSIVLAAY